MSDWDLWAILEAGVLGRIIAFSLAVSVSATALATLFGTPLGAALAVYRFPGRQIFVVTFNALLGLPPVVVGLALYLLLSRSGLLGALGMLFTPCAMVLAQTVLALPIVTALVHSASADLWAEYGGALQVRWRDAAARHSASAGDGTAPAGHRRSRRLWPHDLRGRSHSDRRREYRRIYTNDDDDDRSRNQQG